MLEILFYILLALLIHNYVVFPLSLKLYSKGRFLKNQKFSDVDQLPSVSILLAAFNEESVIKEKIETTFKTDYPVEKIEFLIGSDASTDQTNQIILKLVEKYQNISFKNFETRSGKVKIINALSEVAKGDILILTDANVMFQEDTLFHLVKHFKDQKIGLVGGNILNYNIKKDGISFQEKSYLSVENQVKYFEGVLWGTMMGAFGGIYAIRRSLYVSVPENFIVDDFFQTLQVIDKNKSAINELDAIAYEDVSNNIQDEFRRKARIGAGNYQNLFRFSHFFNPFKWGRFYSFFSHKVLRWLGPFFIIGLFVLSFLMRDHMIYKTFFIVQLATMLVPLLDSLLKKLKTDHILIRFISHFYLMNLALLSGFFKYIKGVKNSTWSPTKRFQ